MIERDFMRSESTSDEGKLAILILAHKNLSQLIRLVKKFKHSDIDVFIHVDKKWNLNEEEINTLSLIGNKNVYICDKRISAFLDKWSLVEATIELIKRSKQVEKEKGRKYIYSALLSGQDYPIKSNDHILNLLKSSYPKPFIDCTPYERNNFLYVKFNRLPTENKIYMFINAHMAPSLIRKVFKLPFFALFNSIKIFRNNPHDRLRALGYKLYGGSAWWLLPDIVVDHILKKYGDPNDTLVSILKDTFTPEETFFQIMTMESEVADMVNKKSPNQAFTQECLTYAHFYDEEKPFVGHPYILTMEDYQKIANLPHCFARKFEESIDTDILDMIDENILNVKLPSS